MSERRVVWVVVVIAMVGMTAAGMSLAPTIALFSDADTFGDAQLGAADDWNRVSIDASVTSPANESATLKATLENDGAAPVVADYEMIVDNEPVDSGIVELASGENKMVSYELDTTEPGNIDWQITANNETEIGTLTVENSTAEEENSTAEGESATSEVNDSNETESDAAETDGDKVTTLDSNGGPESENSTGRSQDGNSTDGSQDGASTDGSQDNDSTDDGSDETDSTASESETSVKESDT